ncbi:MAG: SDR family oxidoreductase [Chloroflexi bacterium]|nr:SDR family oxidoreductase [Chloroflexota bacterium]
MDYGLKNRVALVTGGSEGIGKATAALLAAEGSRVAICARRPDVLDAAAEDIRRSTEAEVLAIPTDLRDADSVDNLIATINDAWGGVDVLVNNAGVSSAMPFEQLTDDALLADMQLKLFGWLRTIRGVLPHMKEQRWGRIINMTAIAAKAPAASSYPSSVSRAAGIALTKALSKELAPHNILVNTVLIGLIKAGQHEHRWEANPNGQSLEERYAEMGVNVPLGRVGESEEAANLITFLASERASFITGTAINMDGGVSPVV